MIKNILTAICVLFVFGAIAQNGTLNGSFENWNVINYSEPDYYRTANSEIKEGKQTVVNVTKEKDPQNGTYSIQLETMLNGSDTVGAYIANGDPFQSQGGIAYAERPTALTGFYKGNIMAGDTAFVFVSFRKSGTIISFDIYKITGMASSYTPFTLNITLPPVIIPDSVVVGATSSNIIAGKGIPGSVIMFDNFSFTGVSSQPTNLNGDFENWTDKQVVKLNDWYVSGGVSQSSDKHTGMYAAELMTGFDGQQNMPYSGLIANNMYIQNGNGYYGRPFTNQVDTLVGWYKYLPTNVDSGYLSMSFVKAGVSFYYVSFPFVSNSSYTKFEVPFDAGMAPDSVKIMFSSSFANTTLSDVGTKLILDDVYFKSQLLNITGIVTDVTCNGGKNGVVNITVAGGSTPYTYSWSNGETTEDLGGLAAGTYTVNVTDASNVLSVNTFTVSEPSALSLNLTSADAACGQNDGSASVSVSGGVTPYSYSWSQSGTDASVSNIGAGVYYVMVTDNNNCSSSSAIAVNNTGAPSSSFTTVNVNCFGQSTGSAKATVTGGSTPYTYSWSNTATTDSIGGLIAATYAFEVTDNIGCKNFNSVTITEPGSAVNISVISTTDVLCFGGSTGAATALAYGGNTAYTYSWSNNASGAQVSSLTSGTYTVNVMDANGCTATATAVITEPSNAVNVTVSSTVNVLCFGGSNGSATALATGGTTAYSYSWSNNASGAQVLNLTSGTYTVNVVDANGCTATATAVITEPLAALTTVTGSVGDSGYVNVSGGTSPYSYSWSNSSTDAFAKPLAAGIHYVSVTDNNGCGITDSVTIIVNGLSLQNKSGKATIYPNPVSNVMYVNAKDLTGSHVTISIINILGEVVWTRDEKQLTSNYKIDIAANIPKGSYILQIANKSNRSITKFVIE